jgi:ABC-type multidrug transport system ATPase subunit
MGPNGIGKSTLLRIAVGELDADAGKVEWGYETHRGYFAQDHHEQLGDSDETIEEWLWHFCPGKDRGFVRGQLGLMLFSGDDGKKRLSALSGGEGARLVFSRLALECPNVLVLDEPTNHLDLESIEALVEGLRAFDGTLILVSHDRWFVRELATRVVEIRSDGITDYHGTYDEFVHASGDDHLDVDQVVLRARKVKRQERTGPPADRQRGDGGGAQGAGGTAAGGKGAGGAGRLRRLEARRDELTAAIDEAESRRAEIDGVFADPSFYDGADPERVASLNGERASLEQRLAELLGEWESVERELETLARA